MQTLPQPVPQDENSQPEDRRVERPRHVEGIEDAQARRGQQQWVEGREDKIRSVYRTITSFIQQVSGDGYIIEGILK